MNNENNDVYTIRSTSLDPAQCPIKFIEGNRYMLEFIERDQATRSRSFSLDPARRLSHWVSMAYLVTMSASTLSSAGIY
jgi:hypothetical protein